MFRGDAAQRFIEFRIDEQHARAAVLDDVGDLSGAQSKIDWHKNAAVPAHAKERRHQTRRIVRNDRNPFALKHTQAETIRNKRVLAEQDPAVRKQNHDQLRRTAEDPKLARAFLLRSSLIESLREAEQIE